MFYILTIRYSSQITTKCLTTKIMPIMYRLVIIAKNGNYVEFEFTTFNALVECLELYKNCVSNMVKLSHFTIILP